MLLKIASGFTIGSLTTELDFITDKFGIQLGEYRPATAQMKAGGVWSDSPMAHGRELRYFRETNIVDTIGFTVRGESPDDALDYLRDLLDLMEKARTRWTHGSAHLPYWLIVQGPRETGPKYSLIFSGQIPEYEDMFGDLFVQPDGTAIMEDVGLIIEHSRWYSEPEARSIGYVLSFNSDYFGNSLDNSSTTDYSSALDDVFVSNYGGYNNLTHIFNWGANLTFHDGNRLDTAFVGGTVAILMPDDFAAVSTQNYLYLGIADTVTNWGPFGCVVFNISADSDMVAANYASVQWEYYDGSAWQTFPANSLWDQTASGGKALLVTGSNSVTFMPPDSWEPNTINSVNAYWIRLSYFYNPVAGGTMVVDNRYPFVPSWNSTTIPQSQLASGAGHIAKITVEGTGGYWNGGAGGADDEMCANKLYVAARPTSLGANFRSCLSARADFLPSWASVAYGTYWSHVEAHSGGAPPYAAITYSYTYKGWGKYTAQAPASTTGFQSGTLAWTLDEDADYRGDTYRVFLRYYTASTEPIEVQMRVGVYWGGSYISYSEAVWADDTGMSAYLADMGEIAIPASAIGPIEIRVQINESEFSEAGDDIYIVDIHLMPTSHYFNLFYGDRFLCYQDNTHSHNTTKLVVDGYDFQSGVTSKLLYDTTTGLVICPYHSRVAAPPTLESNEEMELFFLFDMSDYETSKSLTSIHSIPEQAYRLQIHTLPVLHGPRGRK